MCHFCDCQNPDPAIPIPGAFKQTGPDPFPYACVSCATKKGFYCPIHQQSHNSYDGGHHACAECVKVMTESHRSDAELLQAKLRDGLVQDQYTRLEQHASFLSDGLDQYPTHHYIAELIAISALSQGVSFEEAYQAVLNQRTADLLLGAQLI